MPTPEDIFKEKQRFINQITSQLEGDVEGLSRNLLKLLINKFVDELDREGDNILPNNRNLQLVTIIDQLWREFQGKQGLKLAQAIAENVRKISNYNVDYFGSMGINEAAVPAAAEKVRTVINDRLGLGDKTRLKPGGYMDQLVKDNSISSALKDLSFREISKGTGFKGFKNALEALIVGDDQSLGRFRQYYRNYAYDIYVNVDTLEQTLIAKELDLQYFVYEGTLIETSREFCIKRAGKVWTIKEAEEWINDPWIKTNLEKGRIASYNPTVDRGLWACRHLTRFISKAVAYSMRPDLKTKDPQLEKPPKPKPKAEEPAPATKEVAPVPFTGEDGKKYVGAGKNINSQFDNFTKQNKKIVEFGLEKISEVHGDGELQNIPFINMPEGKSSYGYFKMSDDLKSPIEIAIKEDGNWPELTAIHEMGHYLDFYSIGKKGEELESRNPKGELKGVIDAAKKSKSISTMLQHLKDGFFETPDGERVYMIGTALKNHSYLTQEHEIFARAYAQFIATKTGDKKLLTQLGNARRTYQHLGFQHQWDDDDFKEIAKAMEKAFKKLGWISQSKD